MLRGEVRGRRGHTVTRLRPNLFWPSDQQPDFRQIIPHHLSWLSSEDISSAGQEREREREGGRMWWCNTAGRGWQPFNNESSGNIIWWRLWHKYHPSPPHHTTLHWYRTNPCLICIINQGKNSCNFQNWNFQYKLVSWKDSRLYLPRIREHWKCLSRMRTVGGWYFSNYQGNPLHYFYWWIPGQTGGVSDHHLSLIKPI